jgi:hypothetical protein
MSGGVPRVGRWFDYFLERGTRLGDFFREHFAGESRSVLIVLARSFDPRTTLGLELLVGAGGEGRRDVRLLAYEEEGTTSVPELARLKEANEARVRELVAGKGEVTEHVLEFYSDGRRVASQRAADIITGFDQIGSYSDLIVDVSGMPRGVFFPLIARLLHLIDDARKRTGRDRPNLFALVAEDAGLDAAITQEGVEEFADFVATFRGAFDQEARSNVPKVWIPILGENRQIQLERIYDLVKPDEICPVLPSPAKDPRRADNIMRDYRDFLFNQLVVDPRNLVFAAEQNPFEVYRSLREVVLHYEDALAPLGGCRVALSSLSSKLMSLGTLLAAYELTLAGLKIAVAHVDSQQYSLLSPILDSEIFGLWLAGECYEQ